MSANTSTQHWFSIPRAVARSRRRHIVRSVMGVTALTLLSVVALGTVSAASTACLPSLGLAAPFAVLGGAGVTTSGTSSVAGNLASAVPLDSATGLTPGLLGGLLGTLNAISSGDVEVANAAAQSAEGAATSAYQSAAADVPTHAVSGSALINATLIPGIYAWKGSLSLEGLVTLNALGNRNADFVFQIPGNLSSAANSVVSLKDGAQAGNVLWQVGGSAVLSPATSLVGTILADHAITIENGTSLLGRAQSLTGIVNLEGSSVTLPRVLSCIGATAGPVASSAIGTVASGTVTVPAGSASSGTGVPVPNVLPLIPLSAIAVPDLAVPSQDVSEAAALVPSLLGVIPLGAIPTSVAIPSARNSGVSVPGASTPSTSTAVPSISLPLNGVSLPSFASPSTSTPSVPSLSSLIPDIALPSTTTPALPSVSLPFSTPATSTPSVPILSSLLPQVSLLSLASPSTSTPSVPSLSSLIPDIALPSTTTPPLPSVSLPLLSTPATATGTGTLIHGNARPSSSSSKSTPAAHAKSTTTTTVPSGTSIPVGAPATGEGGTTPSWWGRGAVAFGALMLAAGSIVLGIRRRHAHG
jgi:hypothetical protein